MATGRQPHLDRRPRARLGFRPNIQGVPRHPLPVRYHDGWHLGPRRIDRARELARRSPWARVRRSSTGLRRRLSARRRDQPDARTGDRADLALALLVRVRPFRVRGVH